MKNLKEEKTKKERPPKKSNYEEAIATIERNINKIYIDGVIDMVMTNIRLRLKIDDGMYHVLQDESDKIDKIKDLHILVQHLTDEWVRRAFKNEMERKNIAKHIAKEEAVREHANTNTSKAEIDQLANIVSENIADKYLKRQIETYPLSDAFVIFPTRINLKIWKSIVDAKLFNVPIKKVLGCKELILENDYLPSADMSNGNSYININELTTQGDIALIWDTKIKKIKQEYKDTYNYENSGRSCKDDKTDRIMFELNNLGKKPKEISDILYDDYGIEIMADKISTRLKEIRKRSRNNLKNNLLLKYGE